MARTWVVLDPPGYKRTVHEAWDYQLRASDFQRIFITNPAAQAISTLTQNFFFPGPLASWISCMPRQFVAPWNYDSRLGDHVLRQVQWTFATGLSPYETNPPQKVSTAVSPIQPANKWITIPRIPDTTTSLDATDYGSLGDAIGGDLPAGTVTVATCDTTPADDTIPRDALPHMRYLFYPNPDDVMVWGWNNMAAVQRGRTLFLCRSPSGDRDDWEQVYRGDITLGPVTANPQGNRTSGGGPAAIWDEEHFGIRTQILTILQHGPNEVYLYSGAKHLGLAVLQNELPIGPITSPFIQGNWWIAGFPGQRLTYQAQIVGFEAATTSTYHPVVFDLGALNNPTATLQHNALFFLHDDEVTFSEETSGYRQTGDNSGEVAEYAPIWMDGTKWASDGAHHVGSFRLALTPGNTAGGGYLAPQWKLADLHFPATLTPRSVSTLVLSDQQFRTWMMEANSHEPDQGRLCVELTPGAAAALEAANLHERTDYPIHITEGPTSPGAVLIGAGWVQEVLLDEERVAMGGEPDVSLYRIEARSLLTRADQPWPSPPCIVDPGGGGYVEHTYAVGRALDASRFDPTDTNVVRMAPDPDAGTAISQLPGTWGVKIQGTDQDDAFYWAPRENEHKLDYMLRLGRHWSDWLVYTRLDGLIWYHPQLVSEIVENGAVYFLSATIYRTRAEAVAAGAPEGQRYLAGIQRDVVQPTANQIIVPCRTRPPEEPGPSRVLDADSIVTPSAENFIGEEKTRTIETDLAVGRDAADRIARTALRRHRLRRVIRSFRVPMAPWELLAAAPVDVGYVVRFQGRGTYVIRHIQVRLLQTDHYITRITGERLPAVALPGDIIGAYPGVGVELIP